MDAKKPARGISFIPILIYLGFILCLTLAAAHYLNQGKLHMKRAAFLELETIADLKVGQIASWRRERLNNAEVISENPFNALRVIPFLDEKLPPNDPIQDIRAWILARMKINGFADAALVDSKGRVRLALGPSQPEVGPYAQKNIAEVMRSGHGFLSDFHISGPLKPPHLDLYAPILRFPLSRAGTSCAGVLLFRIDPNSFLYPLIQSWPVPSATGETLLVRREGENVLFLNELRHRKNTALSLQVPINKIDLPAAQAARGREGPLEGRDYRGVPVMAVSRHIPDSPWFMVAKEDISEVFAPLRGRTYAIIIFLITFCFALGLALLLWEKRRDAEFYRQQYEAEHNRLALIHHFEYLHKYANDIIFLSDHNHKIVEANDKASLSYGYTHEELINMSVIELRPLQVRADFEENVRLAKEKNGLVFESLHQRKDKTVFPVEISLRVFNIDDQTYHQAIIRDITERRKAQEQIQAALQEKDVLLKEIHHRVKNNMQIISSLLNLQSSQFKDERVLGAFKESQNRIRSMALAHEKLYKTRDLAHIDIGDYFKGLISHLFLSYQIDAHRVRLRTNMAEIFMDINTAIPCGLIVNELISNALEHAFPEGRAGEIYIELKKVEPQNIMLTVRDDGVGFPPGLDIHKTETLGMQIITLLVQQLEGRIDFEREGGTTFKILFKQPMIHQGRED